MAATFDPTMPTYRDQIRFALGDVDIDDPDAVLLQDEVYDAEIARQTDYRRAGVILARGLAAQFAQQPDSITITGEGSFRWGERIGQWNRQIVAWEAAIAADAVVSSAGMLNVAATREGVVRGEWTRPYRY